VRTNRICEFRSAVVSRFINLESPSALKSLFQKLYIESGSSLSKHLVKSMSMLSYTGICFLVHLLLPIVVLLYVFLMY